jgi:hypothetical protein
MQRLKGRNIVFGALAVLACSGDPTGNESTPTVIQVNPDPVFVTQGDSQPVVVQVLDEDGNVLQAEVTTSNVGSGITVRPDPTYQQVNTGNPISRGARFFVSGVTLTHSSFTVNSLGLTQEVEVTSVPGELDAEITDSLPDLGDTVSITAPAGTFFTDSSVITFNGAEPVVTALDATTLTFIPFANIDGPASVSNVGVESNSHVVFALTTPFRVKTDSIVDLGTDVDNTAPALGDPISLTLPAGLRVIPESLQQSGVGADTLPRGLSIAGVSVQPRDITVSADSGTITFVPPPSADSVVVVPGVIPQRLATCCGGAANYPLTLPTTAKVVTPVIDSIPATLSTTAPAANEEVTLTITDGSFTLDPAATVVVGAAPATVVGRTANSLTFVPTPGAAAAEGAVTVAGVQVAGFSLTLPSEGGLVTVGALTPLAGTATRATAPTLPLPGAGATKILFDLPDMTSVVDPLAAFFASPDWGGAGGTAFYKISVPAAGDYTITADWDIGSDLDLIVCGDPVDEAGFTNCDFQAATGDHPQTGTFSLTAGSHFIMIQDFGGDAAGATIILTIEH